MNYEKLFEYVNDEINIMLNYVSKYLMKENYNSIDGYKLGILMSNFPHMVNQLKTYKTGIFEVLNPEMIFEYFDSLDHDFPGLIECLIDNYDEYLKNSDKVVIYELCKRLPEYAYAQKFNPLKVETYYE